MLALARQGCDGTGEIDGAPVFAVIRGLLDAFERSQRKLAPPPLQGLAPSAWMVIGWLPDGARIGYSPAEEDVRR
jgi:hypothetical protein